MSTIRRTSIIASLRRLLDQRDDDSLDVALRLDCPFAQFLRKLAPEFEREDKPHVVWHRGRLGSASDSEPRCGGRVEERGQSLPRHRREGKLGLTDAGAVGARLTPSGHGATTITLTTPLHASEVPSTLSRPCRAPSPITFRRCLHVGGSCRGPATSGRSSRSPRRALSAARLAPPRRRSAPSSASTRCAASCACTRSTRLR